MKNGARTPRGTPQGGVVSPLLSNILLTPFDKEMRRQGYKLTRWADDWVVTCRTRAEAEHALVRAVKILEQLGVALNLAKTRIVHITRGFEFLGFKIQRGKGKFRLTPQSDQIQTESAESLCHSHTEVGGPIQGSDQD